MITEPMEQNVIEITLNKSGFEYDIHSLVKAFYPECEVRVHAEGEGEPGSSSDGYPDLSLQIGEEEIVLVLIQAGGDSSSEGGSVHSRKSAGGTGGKPAGILSQGTAAHHQGRTGRGRGR